MGKSGFGSGQENATEGFGDVHGGGLILGEKESLGGECVRLVNRDQILDFSVNQLESVGEGVGWSFDQSIGDGGELGSTFSDDSVSDSTESRIDAENDHRLNLRRRSPFGHVMVMGRPWGQRYGFSVRARSSMSFCISAWPRGSPALIAILQEHMM